MGLETSLTSKTWNPFDGSTYADTDKIEFDYSTLGFTPSSGDSYKSTSGDIFKVYVGGVRIYRTNDSSYASGTGFLEDGDTATGLNGVSATWSDTSNNVWEIDTANQLIKVDTGNILATNLYKNGGIYPSGSGNSNITFTSSTIIEVRRSTQNESSPSVDFSNASILTEQDLDNSSLNVFHMAQQAVVAAEKALPFNSGTGVYEAYQPGTATKKRITQVADGVNANDATNVGQFDTHDAAIEAQKVATLAYQENTEDYKLETADWATKVNGVVNTYTANVAQNDGAEYSAKAYSVGGTGVTGGTNRGSAKDWAVGAGGVMATKPDGSEYSAKEYAQGQTAATGSAKQWALGGGAFNEATAVQGDNYSARKYASDASASETAAANSAAAVSQVYDNFNDVYLGAMRTDKTSADGVTLTGASWAKDSSSIAFTGISSGAVTSGQELTSTGTGYPVDANIIGTQLTTPIVISKPFTAAGTGATLTFAGTGVYGAFSDSAGGPSLNNDGDALVNGNLYFNSQENEMRIWQGAEWIAATAVGQTSLIEYKYVTNANQADSGHASYKIYSGADAGGSTLSYTQDNIIVFMNGVQLKDTTDYTATNSSSVVLVDAPALNDEINIVVFKSFTTADMVSKTNGGTFAGAVTFSSGLTGNVTGNASGTAATVTTAAQPAITSVGTLTTLTVDNVIVNGTTIGHTSDTDLLTLTSGNLAVAGDLETSTTGKVKQKGAFMQSSTHQALTLGY